MAEIDINQKILTMYKIWIINNESTVYNLQNNRVKSR